MKVFTGMEQVESPGV